MKKQNSVAAKVAPVVAAPVTPVVAAPVTPVVAAPVTVVLPRSARPRKGSSIVFEIPGTKSLVKFPRSAS